MGTFVNFRGGVVFFPEDMWCQNACWRSWWVKPPQADAWVAKLTDKSVVSIESCFLGGSKILSHSLIVSFYFGTYSHILAKKTCCFLPNDAKASCWSSFTWSFYTVVTHFFCDYWGGAMNHDPNEELNNWKTKTNQKSLKNTRRSSSISHWSHIDSVSFIWVLRARWCKFYPCTTQFLNLGGTCWWNKRSLKGQLGVPLTVYPLYRA